jgi:hypothetical protein
MSEIGRIATEKGRRAETRALEAVKRITKSWMRSVRAASLKEDAAGIDIVVESDVGKLYLQVKSSKGSAKSFAKRPRRQHIEIIVVPIDLTDTILDRRVLEALERARTWVLDGRVDGDGALPPLDHRFDR